jgi:MFS family permease
VAYIPFLTILLPIRVGEMTGAERVHWLAYITFFGAIAASAGGIFFGWLSDLSRVRRPWIVAGLIATVAGTMLVPHVHRPLELLVLIVGWQLALNMMLGPLAAWGADVVPAEQLGALGGLLALSPALGSAAGAFVTIPGLAGADARLGLIAVLVGVAVLPALVLNAPSIMIEPVDVSDRSRIWTGRHARSSSAAMWFARLLVQISEATLFAYLYYYFRSIDPSRDASWIAQLFGMVLCMAVPIALLIGRWSDLNGRPILPLIAAATSLGAALMWMALASTSVGATLGYVFFGVASTIFLSLHSAQTLRVLGNPDRRGRDLGLFNLTNTIPSLIMPWLTVAIVPRFGFSTLFILLASLAFGAAIILQVFAHDSVGEASGLQWPPFTLARWMSR